MRIARIQKYPQCVPTFADIGSFYDDVLSPTHIDPADRRVFDAVFRRGAFSGIFQFTSPSTQRFVQDLDPRNVTDIAVATAIYRPGPLAAHVDREFVEARRSGKRKDYGHKIIDETLSDTLGFMVFQEDIQQIAISLGGFSDDDADRLRKAILKRTVKDAAKGKSLTEELHDKFIVGAVANGYPEAKAEALYDDMRAFSTYAFNRGHAAAYGFISYQCAWLSTYFEAEWLCAYVESMLGDPDTRRRALAEIRERGYNVAKVDINRSGHDWEISEDSRTFFPSFQTVKGIGSAAIDEILSKRPYERLEDLLWDPDGAWRHSKLNSKVMSALVRVGAFDSMGLVGPNRTFANYRQLHHVVVDGQTDLKKRLKRDPDRHVRRLAELVEEAKTLPDWDRTEAVKTKLELFGSVEPEELIDRETARTLEQHGIPPIETVGPTGGSCWFVLAEATKKATKAGRSYFVLQAFGSDGSQSRVFVWNTGSAETSVLTPFACYVVKLRRDKVGTSCTLRDLKEVGA